jgi:osmotically-inducible protein OsmY
MKSDKDLQHDVMEELKWEPSVNAAHIGVTVTGEVVALTGHVPSYAEKHAAVQAVKRVLGVKAVADELEVTFPGGSNLTDEDVAQACVAALASHYAMPGEKIQVVVKHGWVTVEGEVEWQYQKTAIENAVRWRAGVKGVTNNVRIQPRLSPVDLKAKIEAAFKRSAEIDAGKVTVEAKDSKVTLRGIVRSWVERDEAQRVAWSAPGVASVDNKIMVTI